MSFFVPGFDRLPPSCGARVLLAACDQAPCVLLNSTKALGAAVWKYGIVLLKLQYLLEFLLMFIYPPPHPDAAVMSMVCMVPLGHISEKELERKKREVGEVRREIEVSSYYCSRLLIDYCRITSRLLIRTVSRLYSYIRGELAILL